ncbi:type I-B CRISPR-associated protein Cas8b1/Cst1 [Archaeoglobus veneficus]|uniref:CRISPR-associated protein CXXC_CXXC region n=1 Tax=Archaeoglobus veneficus (strain DSM 11195 / SNP6) TaxID=693661 RepID=F2KRM7_ARCVS|nr:type I-B CRISPR-associated protein Cas8b1/Cst1 [Archaeoglobus veneficus]AEA46792.1 CRISPR-associated protein CXXC_CXXC region [Archaeoglobus veneficus SNP6]
MSSSNLVEDHTEEEKQVDGIEFYWTGHPFVDAGLAAILLIAGKNKPEELNEKDIEKAIDFASKLYATKEWSSSYLHGMIFPNSGILMANPSMTKKRSPEAIAENLWSILEEFKVNNRDSPKCVLCGRRPAYTKKEVYLSVFPLLGTGGVPNFFHSANTRGADICAHCIFLTQFMPLASYRLSKPPRVLVIHAYPYELMFELSKEALEDIKKSKLASQARGFRRPENFLFHLVGEITRKIERDEVWENSSVSLYYFICNNQSQILDVIYVPTPVLRFVAYANLVDEKGWKHIVSMGWGRQPSDEEFEKFERSNRNEVYSRLLNNESILPYFINRTSRQTNTVWSLLAFYCSEVLGLDEKVLDFIKDIGDRIVETIGKLPEHKLDDEVRSLERAEKLYQFEAFFIRVEKLRQNLGIERPLMTFDEFARILTAYGEDINISWRTVKNLLLFRIYEKLHDRLMKSVESKKIEEMRVEESEYAIYGGGEE